MREIINNLVGGRFEEDLSINGSEKINFFKEFNVKRIMMLGLVFTSLVAATSRADFICFDSGKGRIGRLIATDKNIGVNFAFCVDKKVDLSLLSGWTQSYSKNGQVLTASAYLDSRSGDGFSATFIIEPQKVTLKEKDRLLGTYPIVPCPQK